MFSLLPPRHLLSFSFMSQTLIFSLNLKFKHLDKRVVQDLYQPHWFKIKASWWDVHDLKRQRQKTKDKRQKTKDKRQKTKRDMNSWSVQQFFSFFLLVLTISNHTDGEVFFFYWHLLRQDDKYKRRTSPKSCKMYIGSQLLNDPDWNEPHLKEHPVAGRQEEVTVGWRVVEGKMLTGWWIGNRLKVPWRESF